jgi:hypothetical protein
MMRMMLGFGAAAETEMIAKSKARAEVIFMD